MPRFTRREGVAKAFFWILGLATAIHYCVTIVGIQNRAECQANFDSAVSSGITLRAKLSQQSDANQNRIILEVAKLVTSADGPPPTAAEAKRQNTKYRQLFIDFTAEANRIEAQRAKTTIPTIPDCVR